MLQCFTAYRFIFCGLWAVWVAMVDFFLVSGRSTVGKRAFGNGGSCHHGQGMNSRASVWQPQETQQVFWNRKLCGFQRYEVVSSNCPVFISCLIHGFRVWSICGSQYIAVLFVSFCGMKGWTGLTLDFSVPGSSIYALGGIGHLSALWRAALKNEKWTPITNPRKLSRAKDT